MSKRAGRDRGDWQVNSAAFAGGFILNPGVGQAVVLAGIIPVQQNAGGLGFASPGKLHVAKVDIDVAFFNPGVGAANYIFGVGVYRARYDLQPGGVSQWSFQDMFSPNSASNPWYWLERRSMTLCPNGALTADARRQFIRTVPINATVGQGEAIMVVAANSSASPVGGSLTTSLFCRALVTKMF
jgi:hypothetical protein